MESAVFGLEVSQGVLVGIPLGVVGSFPEVL
jgi:hypothetical protein